MSLTSRKLLTKIYDLTIPQKSTKKKDHSLFRNKLKLRKNDENKNIFEINKTEKGTSIINKTKLRLENPNKTIEVNKFPVIPKLNIKNIKIKEENIPDETKQEKNMLLLDYKLIESSSEDDNHKLRELKNGLNGLPDGKVKDFVNILNIYIFNLLNLF